MYEESQAHCYHYHRINCVHLYNCFTSLWWIYMAKLCVKKMRKKLLTKEMREQGIGSNPYDSNPLKPTMILLVSQHLSFYNFVLCFQSYLVLSNNLFHNTSNWTSYYNNVFKRLYICFFGLLTYCHLLRESCLQLCKKVTKVKTTILIRCLIKLCRKLVCVH